MNTNNRQTDSRATLQPNNKSSNQKFINKVNTNYKYPKSMRPSTVNPATSGLDGKQLTGTREK